MTTTHDDNATTWRDLAGDLAADKVAELADLEQQLGNEGSTPREVSAIMLTCARDSVLHRTIDAAYADIAMPAGAAGVSGWEQNLRREGWSRSLVWCSFGDSEMSFDIDSRQRCDGSYTRQISVMSA
jgi:hypothetical protein